MKILNGPTDEETDSTLIGLTSIEKVNLCLRYPFPVDYIKSAFDRGIMDDLDQEDVFLLCKQYQLGDKYFQIAIAKGLFSNQRLYYYRLRCAAETDSVHYIKKELQPCDNDVRFLRMINHLLMSASEWGAFDVVKYLVSVGVGADVNFSYKNETPLMNAAFNGKIEVVRILVENGADRFFMNENGATVLNYAFPNFEIMKYFLELGVHPDSGYPLLEAAMYNQLEVIDLLLEYGSDINIQDPDHDSAILNAYATNNIPLLEYLISKCAADVNLRYHNGNTLLIYAAKMGNLDVVKLLIENGADPCAKNRSGKIALDWAVKNGNWDVVDYLYELSS